MSDNNSFFFFDQLEKKFVFKISRSFLILLTAISVIILTASIITFMYSVIPPSKEEVVLTSLPTSPKINYTELFNKANSQDNSSQETKQTNTNEHYTQNKENIKQEIDSLMNVLGTSFPSDWEGVYQSVPNGTDFYGNYAGYTKVLMKQGIKNRVEYFIKELEDTSKIHILKNMVEVIPKFKIEQREKILNVFFTLSIEKWKKYAEEVNNIQTDNKLMLTRADEKFILSKAKKNDLESKAIKGIIGGILLIAFIGLILSSFAIERNTRTIRELLEKNIQEEGNNEK